MIYIVDVDLTNNIQKYIFDKLNIDYKLYEPSYSELDDLINSDNYTGILFGLGFREYLENKYKQEFQKNKGIDLIYKKNDNITFYNSLYEGLSRFFDDMNVNLNNKTTVILGSSYTSRVVYEVIKDKFLSTVYIASITKEVNKKLRPGDIRIKKVEIMNLEKVDFIINTTELGNINQENYCLLDNEKEVPSREVLDMVYYPVKTTFIRKYENKGSKIYSGLNVIIYQTLYAICKITNKYEYFEKFDEVYDYLYKLLDTN
ncbi:Rossmann-fold NAD(P)-binding domain-containing protein [Caviibacter abscessus]|uniref:hypothetical protein n=1 Tax=Caviibacter abscessus TaxID=1766719 RepID=UPI00082B7FEC|nr:hypothetical protein [Caviibacter abscessus]